MTGNAMLLGALIAVAIFTLALAADLGRNGRSGVPHSAPPGPERSVPDPPAAESMRGSPVTQSERFFAVTILAGHLHVGTVEQGAPPISDGKEIDAVFDEREGDRKIRTAEELEAVIKAPSIATFSPKVWVHKSLEDEVRKLWEVSLKEPR